MVFKYIFSYKFNNIHCKKNEKNKETLLSKWFPIVEFRKIALIYTLGSRTTSKIIISHSLLSFVAKKAVEKPLNL